MPRSGGRRGRGVTTSLWALKHSSTNLREFYGRPPTQPVVKIAQMRSEFTPLYNWCVGLMERHFALTGTAYGKAMAEKAIKDLEKKTALMRSADGAKDYSART